MPDIFIASALALLALLSYHHHRNAIILLAALLPTYLLRFSILGLPTNFLEAATALVFLISFIKPTIRSSWRTAWSSLSLSFKAFTLLFLLAALIATHVSPHSLTSLGILKGWIIIPVLFAWLIHSSKTNQQSIIKALLVSGTAVSVVGLLQIGTLDRVRSVYDTPNSLALFLAPLLVIAIWQKRWVYSFPLAAALLATQSASALVATTLALALGVLFWLQPASHKKALIAACLLLFLAVSHFALSGRLAYLTHRPNSISVRLQLWSISWELIKTKPILGAGLGTFEPVYQRQLHERFQEFENCRTRQGHCIQPLAEYVFRDPHNWILSFWLNMGLLGLLSFIGLNILAALLPRQDPSQALALALLGLLIFGLADTIYWKNDLSVLHWTLLALLISGRHRRCGRKSRGKLD